MISGIGLVLDVIIIIITGGKSMLHNLFQGLIAPCCLLFISPDSNFIYGEEVGNGSFML